MAVGSTTSIYDITALCYIGLKPNRPCIGLVAIQKIRYIAKNGLIYLISKRTRPQGLLLDLLTNSSYLGWIYYR